jgi:excisionase family DNA binding protein
MSTKVKYHQGAKNMKQSPKAYYTATELAELLSLNVMTIYRYIKAGRLVAHKIGKEYRIDRAEFKRFMAKTKTK